MTNKKYKALMLDLDGTTIPIINDPRQLPSEKVIKAVKDASNILQVGIATARSLYWSKHIMEALQVSAPCITIGGAQIVDSETYKILWQRTIPKKDTEILVSKLKEFNYPFVYPKDHPELIRSFDITIPEEGQTEIAIPNIPIEEADALIDKLQFIKDLAFHKSTSAYPGKVWLQFTHAEATKQHGILKVAELMGIETHEMIGIGDSYNDFPLLMACGLKVAMGNAVSELKEIADYVAPTVQEDGVADVIEKFVL